MKNTSAARTNNARMSEEMNEYIRALRNMPKEQAAIDAKAALIRTGVLTKNGNVKKKIVSW